MMGQSHHQSFLFFLSLSLLSLTSVLCQVGVRNIELYSVFNAKTHRTNQYESIESIGDLVIRRGNVFNLALELTSPYDPTRHGIVLQFLYGRNPGREAGTIANLKVRRNEQFHSKGASWDVDLFHVKDNNLDLQVFIPATVPIGTWAVRVGITENRDQRVYNVRRNIYVLFNPWSKEDSVYLPDESARQEYVLNDIGKMYMGTYGNREVREWLFGQFKSGVLQAIMFVLDNAGLSADQKSNPIFVSNALSALTNSHDDNGVVVGKWEMPYQPYKAPWQWTGSASILLNYYQSGGNPVRYGQCWVFAGVLTTMCRGLGIPARPITNYGSAHDQNKDLKVERYFDRYGQTNPLTKDSIWNFHVWTEVWMARPDLQQGYDGWQVIDGTPQEPSNGMFRLGPTPVKAVKKGDVLIPYDAPFVYSEVNADIHDYLYDFNTARFTPIKEVVDGVGRLLITKRIGVLSYGLSDAEDITSNYKFREGTREERSSYYSAAEKLGLRLYYASAFTPRKKDVKDVLLYSATPNGVPLGAPFNVSLWLYNQNAKSRSVEISANVSSVYYTGGVANTITIRNGAFVLEPHQNVSFEFQVTPADYMGKLVGLSMLKVFTFVSIKETKQVLNHVHNFKFDDPALEVTQEEQAKPGEPFAINVRFANPFDETLNDCQMVIEAPHYGPKEIEIGQIGAHLILNLREIITIKKPRVEDFVLNLSCNEITNVSGKLQVKVVKENQ